MGTTLEAPSIKTWVSQKRIELKIIEEFLIFLKFCLTLELFQLLQLSLQINLQEILLEACMMKMISYLSMLMPQSKNASKGS